MSETTREDPLEFDLSSPLSSGASIVWRVISSPKRFFLDFETKGPKREPAAFVVFVAAVSAVFGLLSNVVFNLFSGSFGPGEFGIAVSQQLAFVVLAPLAAAVAAGVYLLTLKTFVGGVADFTGLYRMTCYALAPLVLGWVPGVGAFAVTYALLVLMGLGIRYVYRTSFMTAIVVALVSFVPLELGLIFVLVSAARMFPG